MLGSKGATKVKIITNSGVERKMPMCLDHIHPCKQIIKPQSGSKTNSREHSEEEDSLNDKKIGQLRCGPQYKLNPHISG